MPFNKLLNLPAMNKTISINLGGYFFNIEEDAYELLKNYLDRIRQNLANDAGASEIMTDIEVRIAELFQARLDGKKNVVIAKDVEEVKLIMGQPEDYNLDGNQAPPSGSAKEEPKGTQQEGTRNKYRRVYRDADDAVIGGVCSGLSHYFGWDPVVIRASLVALALISGGSIVIGYIVFWAVVPVASTTAEKLQMRGEPVNVENISRFVKEEGQNATERVKRFSENVKNGVPSATNDAVRTLGLVLTKLIGLFALFVGVAILTALLAAVFFADFSFISSDVDLYTLSQIMIGAETDSWMMVLGIALTFGIPAIYAIYGGLKLLIGSTRRIKGFGWIFFFLFVMGGILLSYAGVTVAKEFREEAYFKSEIPLNAVAGDTLYLEVSPDSIFKGRDLRHDHEFMDLVHVTDSVVYYGEPISVSFEPSEDSTFSALLSRGSRGNRLNDASKKAGDIRYHFEAKGDSILLDSYLRTPRDTRYRGQNVEVIIKVPRGKYVHFGPRYGFISWDDELGGRTLRMGQEGWVDYE
jgi:phage shock protein PspC (stress-responsive transcriptional regulator)